MTDTLKPIVGPDGRPLRVGERDPITTEHLQAILDWPPQQREAALREHATDGRHSMPFHAIGWLHADMGRRGKGGAIIRGAQLYRLEGRDAFELIPDDTVHGRAILIAGAALPAQLMAIPIFLAGFVSPRQGLTEGGPGRVSCRVERLSSTELQVDRFVYSDAPPSPTKTPAHGEFGFTLYGWS